MLLPPCVVRVEGGEGLGYEVRVEICSLRDRILRRIEGPASVSGSDLGSEGYWWVGE